MPFPSLAGIDNNPKSKRVNAPAQSPRMDIQGAHQKTANLKKRASFFFHKGFG
jgi:hypothetical protein